MGLSSLLLKAKGCFVHKPNQNAKKIPDFKRNLSALALVSCSPAALCFAGEAESGSVRRDGDRWVLEQSWSGWKRGTGLVRHVPGGNPAKLAARKGEVLLPAGGLGLKE